MFILVSILLISTVVTSYASQNEIDNMDRDTLLQKYN